MMWCLSCACQMCQTAGKQFVLGQLTGAVVICCVARSTVLETGLVVANKTLRVACKQAFHHLVFTMASYYSQRAKSSAEVE